MFQREGRERSAIVLFLKLSSLSKMLVFHLCGPSSIKQCPPLLKMDHSSLPTPSLKLNKVITMTTTKVLGYITTHLDTSLGRTQLSSPPMATHRPRGHESANPQKTVCLSLTSWLHFLFYLYHFWAHLGFFIVKAQRKIDTKEHPRETRSLLN